MTGVNTLKSLQAQRESAVAGKASLTTQVEALTNTLAIQCGYTTGTQIETSDLPVVTAEQVTAIDYDKDLAEALKNSYAIYSKEYAMQTASDDYENNKTNTLYAYQAAKIDRDAQKESTTASFRKLYTDLQEKQTALAAADADLAQAKKTFTVSQVQYTRGMISKMAYTDALDTFTTAQETEVAARIDLLTAYNTYQWAKRGVITATT
ncbi:MAG: TolC family protein [Butyricicoccus sp.]